MTAWYDQSRGGWVAKFTLDGRQHWVKGGPWKRESHALAAEQRLRERLRARRTDETCASFVDRWLEEWPRPEASTNKLYAAAARRFAEEFGPTPLGDVERLSARTWALTVPRKVAAVIGTMYEDARNIGLVEGNPFSGLRLPASEKKAEIEPPTMDEYRALLEGCVAVGGYAAEMKAMIQFSAWTGIRQGELFGLQWSDISADEIKVVRSRKLDGSLGLPKNGQADKMPFIAPARVLDTFTHKADSPFVFHSPLGRPLRKGTFGWSWQKVRAAAGVDCRWHDLRHFCATRLLDLGYSAFDVSVQLRHTDGGILVMRRYGHPDRDAARDRLLRGFEIDTDEIGNLGRSRTAQGRSYG